MAVLVRSAGAVGGGRVGGRFAAAAACCTITQIEIDVVGIGVNFLIPSLSIYTLSGATLAAKVLGTKVGDLTSPSCSTTGVTAWTSTGMDLAANTDYTVLIDFASGGSDPNGFFQNTASDSEDTGAASGERHPPLPRVGDQLGGDRRGVES